MKEKIIQIIREQIKLIEPISIHGTTENIRQHAKEYVSKLKVIVSNSIWDEDFINKNKVTMVSSCMSLYNKLCDDSRNLPTVELREIANYESKEVMKVWEFIEQK